MTAPLSPSLLRYCSRFSSAASITTSVLGCSVLMGWFLNIPLLTSVLPGLATMKANTALTFIFAGIALWCLQPSSTQWQERLGQACASVITLIGLLTFSEHLAGWDLGIDQLLIREAAGAVDTTTPGRMAPATAFSFVLFGSALLILSARRGVSITLLLAYTVLIIAMLALIGYGYGVASFYRIVPYAPVALHTAGTFLLLALGILCACPDQGIVGMLIRDSVGGVAARRMIPLALMIVVVVGWLCAQGQQVGWYDMIFGIALMVSATLILFSGIALWTAHNLDHADKARTDALAALRAHEVELQRAHAELEQRVLERTAALVEANERLEAAMQERVLVMTALEASERRYRALVEHSQGFICTHDLDGVLLSVNAAAAAALEYDPAEMIGCNLCTFLSPETQRHFDTYLEQMRKEAVDSGLMAVRTKGGVRRIWMYHNVWLCENGLPPYVLGYAQDITDLKQIEAALRESEVRFRSLAESAGDAIILTNSKGQVIFWNRGAETIFGHREAEMLGKSLERIIPEQYHMGFREGFARMLATSEALSLRRMVEARGLRQDGSEFPMELSLASWKTHTGIFFSAIGRDVTERKRIEEALRESEQRFRSAVDHAAIGMALVALDGRWLQVNQALCDLVGYSEAELLATTFQAITHPEDLDADLAYARQLLDGTIPTYQMEKRYIHKQGHVVWILLSGSLVRDDQGQPRYFIAQIQDITQRKAAEATIQAVNSQLVASVMELQQHTKELMLLSELSELLQMCRTAEEAYQVMKLSMKSLFPSDSGVLAIVDTSQSLVEIVAAWGTHCCKPTFHPEECLALRRGQFYGGAPEELGLSCTHLRPPLPRRYICAPLRVRGEILGMLHLSRAHPGTMSTAHQRLVQMVTGQLELALANLQLQETLRQQSIRDPLTGLFNRRYMEEALDQEVRRVARSGKTIGVMMLDVDYFKQFNDTYGHIAGDRLLKELGLFLQNQVRAYDIVCRYGGEEFTIIMPETPIEIIQEHADLLRAGIKQLQIEHHGEILAPISLSIGIAMVPEHGTTASVVLQAADAALYLAKHSGRDQAVVASTKSTLQPKVL